MPKLNIFIDGTWLYKACGPEKALSERCEFPEKGFVIDFSRLDARLLKHAEECGVPCEGTGERFLATSIFDLPPDFDAWSEDGEDFSPESIERVKRSTFARDRFASGATNAGYSEESIYRPTAKRWMVQRLIEGKFQEKQVDATVVALLVRSAITKPDDIHCVITGDADILPAIRVAYPQYSRNVFVATTHPDELKASNRQTSFSLANFDFKLPPLFLQDCARDIKAGANVYQCAHCQRIFARPKPIPARARPCCKPCDLKRT